MKEEEFAQIRSRLWDAEMCQQRIHNAENRIDELERFGFKVKLESGKDISDDLPKEAFDEIRSVITKEYRKIIEDNKKKFDSL